MIIKKYLSFSYSKGWPVSFESPILLNVSNFSYYLCGENTFKTKQKFYSNLKCLNVPWNGRTYTSSSKELKMPTEESDLKEKLLSWAIQFRVSHVAFSQLLKILCKSGVQNIPTNSAELMKAKENQIKVCSMPPGVYVHYSLEKSLREIIVTLQEKQKLKEKNVNVSVFIDNLQLKRTTNEGLWVILGSLGLKETIFLIGAFSGISKPNDSNLFLSEFVEEAKTLCTKGLLVNDSAYNISIKRIICDIPAKCFVLNVKYITGYSTCTKCAARGVYLNNKICYPEKSHARTNKDFESDALVKGDKTKLLEIPNFSVVHHMPIDYFHLVCFGCLKKLMTIWWGEEEKYWISKSNISSKLETISKTKPVEFKTKQKPLKNFENWNMFQCREFFHYYMPFVLKNSLHHQYYENFLLLYSACKIFSTKNSSTNIKLGEVMLSNFVETFKMLYGNENVSYNVHNLFHLADDYKLHGPLEDFSSVHFEKYLVKLKARIQKTKKKSFPQIILNHSQQFISSGSLKKLDADEVKVKKRITKVNNSLVKMFNVSQQFGELRLNNKRIIPDNPSDKYVGLKSGKIVEVAHIVKIKEKNCILGKEFLTPQNFWTEPIESSRLSIFKVRSLSKNMKVWNVDEISQKFLKLPLDSEEFLIVPMLDSDY